MNACNQILGYVGDRGFDAFSENQMLLDAVIRNIEVIGEAANKLDENFKQRSPEFPTRDAITTWSTLRLFGIQ